MVGISLHSMNPLKQISPKLQHSSTPPLLHPLAAFRLFVPFLSLLTAMLFAPISGNSTTLRIGYQKAASTLVLLKAHGTLEKKLAPLNVEVKWLEFTAGPQLLEGLNLGSIDFGYVGEVPPIFALAAGAPLVYTACELPSPVAPIQGLEPDIIEASLRHYQHVYKPIDDAVLADQQRIADTFYELKLIPQ